LPEQEFMNDKARLQEDMRLRTEACEAYHQANLSEKLRAAMLARSRPVRREYVLGEWDC